MTIPSPNPRLKNRNSLDKKLLKTIHKDRDKDAEVWLIQLMTSGGWRVVAGREGLGEEGR